MARLISAIVFAVSHNTGLAGLFRDVIARQVSFKRGLGTSREVEPFALSISVG